MSLVHHTAARTTPFSPDSTYLEDTNDPDKNLLFLGHLIAEPNMAPTVRNLFKSRIESHFDTNITSVGVMLSINEMLVTYDLFQYFES